MKTIGLTGSIGMGKTTTAGLLADEGCPVFDADAAVGRLYGVGGGAVEPIRRAFPGAIKSGAVDRDRLSDLLQADPSRFEALEKIVHPLVAEARARFVETARQAGAGFVVFDIPLLFETGMDAEVDHVMVVSAPYAVQRERVLARPGMNEDKFKAILARQMPDSEKRARADIVIDSSRGIEAARDQVRAALKEWTGP
ncbi:MAG: dephospho-CoA kinase [Pseudomonadota bacterium]